MPSTAELSVKSFAQLSSFELYAMLKLGSDVFVVEQSCVYPDLDDKDLHADTQHLLYFNGDVSF